MLDEPRPRITTLLPGVVLAIAAFATYMVGAGRALTFDGGVTAANFIVTDSWWDPFTHQEVFNNHPVFSFLEKVLVWMTGSSSEVTLRFLPAAFGGAAVFLLYRLVEKRLGVLPAVAGAGVLAFHPLMLEQARVVRGYTLLLLLAIWTTQLVLDRRPGPLYAALVAAGLATHLYMVLVVGAHVVIVATRRHELRRWIAWLAGSAVVGLAAYAAIVPTMLEKGSERGFGFRRTFPVDLTWELLGRKEVAVAIVAALVVVGLAQWRHTALARPLALYLVVAVFAPWVAAPIDLYFRFFMWLLPVVAFLVASAVVRDRRLVVAAVVLPVIWLASMQGWNQDIHSNRVGGELVTALGDRPCLAGWTAEATEFYAPDAELIYEPREVVDCDAVLFTDREAHPELLEAAEERLPCRTEAGGPLVPGLVLHHCPVA